MREKGKQMISLALDLCCGKGGWTIELWPGYAGTELLISDVRLLNFKNFGRKISLVCASPPYGRK